MKLSLVPVLQCPACRSPSLAAQCFESTDGRCRSGVLTCNECSAWYPISNFVLELLPVGATEPGWREEFLRRHRSALTELGLRLAQDEGEPRTSDFSPQIKQRQHFDDLARREDKFSYTSSVGRAPFWEVTRDKVFDDWNHRVRPGSLLLDIGCADGLSTFPMAQPGVEILAFDISRESLLLAQAEAEARGVQGVTFFVADADAIPLRAETIDCVTCFGSLHHVPDPAHTLAEAERVLKPGGQYLGVENNKTPVRPIFDLLMRLRPIWKEEAGAEAQIGQADLGRWTESSSLRLASRSMVFVPPHLCNWLGVSAARRLLRWTDAILGRIPLLRRWGGLIRIVGRKLASTGPGQDPDLGDLANPPGEEIEAGPKSRQGSVGAGLDQRGR